MGTCVPTCLCKLCLFIPDPVCVCVYLIVRRLLLELEKGEYGWPFTRPVSSKQFPSYRKYIKQPMDFTTMKHKLKDNM